MPTYDYECDACGHAFEQFQNISDALLTKCPSCRKPKLRRLFGTGAAVMFKGSGFYQTDYRSESYKKRAAADSKPSESSGDGKASSSDKAASRASDSSAKSDAKPSAAKKND